MRGRKLPLKMIALLRNHLQRRFECEHSYRAFLGELGIGRCKVNPEPLPIIARGALWGALAEAGTLTTTVILSDDAGQLIFGNNAV